MRHLVARFRRNEEGAAMVEYALLVGLIALVAIVGVSAAGTSINAQFAKITCKISNPAAACTE
jgi:pilus assembly protein Flp/PilA